MNNVLVLFAHPRFEQSRTNKVLVDAIKKKEGVTFHDLYERYPDFNIDVLIEKNLLANHDVIIWHHPLYWYSSPPLLKQWIDIVLEFGWAYGPEGDALKGKKCMNVITTGGTRQVYCSEGKNHYTIPEFLRPFEQTARLCGMDYMLPFAVMGTHALKQDDIENYALQYETLIDVLRNGNTYKGTDYCELMNDVAELKSVVNQ